MEIINGAVVLLVVLGVALLTAAVINNSPTYEEVENDEE